MHTVINIGIYLR